MTKKLGREFTAWCQENVSTICISKILPTRFLRGILVEKNFLSIQMVDFYFLRGLCLLTKLNLIVVNAMQAKIRNHSKGHMI